MKETFSKQQEQKDITSTYVLVHGAWQAPYVWDDVRSYLTSRGNRVIIVELPAHGADNTPAHTTSLEVYSRKVISAVLEEKKRVILVGHSMAGMVISNVAENVPEKIIQLVYIGAFLPASGQSLTDLAYADPDSKLGNALIPSADQLMLDIKREELTYLFVNDGSKDTKEQLIANYRAEPAIPFSIKISLTEKNFGSVPKVYIKTLQDLVISTFLQDKMIAAANIKKVYNVDTSHSPFLSQFEVVANLLHEIGQTRNMMARELNIIG